MARKKFIIFVQKIISFLLFHPYRIIQIQINKINRIICYLLSNKKSIFKLNLAKAFYCFNQFCSSYTDSHSFTNEFLFGFSFFRKNTTNMGLQFLSIFHPVFYEFSTVRRNLFGKSSRDSFLI